MSIRWPFRKRSLSLRHSTQIIIAEYVCRNVCRSIPADGCQCGHLAHVSADKTTGPAWGSLNSNPAVPI